MKENYTKALIKRGFEIKSVRESTDGHAIIEASTETPRGEMEVVICTNGTAMVEKPNGTHKWLYQKSICQLFRAIDQSLEFYKA